MLKGDHTGTTEPWHVHQSRLLKCLLEGLRCSWFWLTVEGWSYKPINEIKWLHHSLLPQSTPKPQLLDHKIASQHLPQGRRPLQWKDLKHNHDLKCLMIYHLLHYTGFWETHPVTHSSPSLGYRVRGSVLEGLRICTRTRQTWEAYLMVWWAKLQP